MWRRFIDIAGVVFFFAVLSIISWRCWTRLRPQDQPDHPTRSAMADFQDVVYYPSRAALAGVNPYDARSPEEGGRYMARYETGNTFPLYSPLILILGVAFAVLPLAPAEIAYGLLNVGLLLVYVYVLLRLVRVPTRMGTIATCAALLLLSRPGHANFYFGAIALPLILATLGAWIMADREPWISAIGLLLAIIKPTFGGPLFVLMALRGSYRPAFIGLFLAAAVNLTVIAALLPHDLVESDWFKLLAHNQAVIDADPAVDALQSASRVDLVAVIERLAGQQLPGFVRFGVTFMVLGVAGWSLRQSNHTGEEDMLLSCALASLTIGICIYHNIYDAMVIAVPAALVWRELVNKNSLYSRPLLWLLLGCLTIPAVNYFSSKQFWLLLTDFEPQLGPPLAMLNGIAFAVAWCVLLTMVRSAHPGERRTRTQGRPSAACMGAA
jgi:hypothetical protein